MSIEANEFVLEKQAFNLDTFLQSLFDLIYLHANRKHIVIKLEKGPNVPEMMNSDEKRLHQILLHLLMNAVKYSTQFKTITIRIAVDTTDPHMLAFQVADQGIGIPRDKQIRLFKLFGGGEEAEDRRNHTKQGKPSSEHWQLASASRSPTCYADNSGRS